MKVCYTWRESSEWIFVVLTNILMHYTISLYDIDK
ncbi:hypothetical protein COPEUT_02886 [Coprococcus eutactus ATCC 27759]|nr:hypothetical protein COPEUT_02886 [Coprococcus eutactus ATCC 27759]